MMMANLRAVYLQPDEIDAIVTPVLEQDFKRFGYRDKVIREDETFEGEPIIRVRADVEQPVPGEELVKTLTRLHAALEARNDERFVFLSAPGPEIISGDDADEDAE
jgi:hypothetical protein